MGNPETNRKHMKFDLVAAQDISKKFLEALMANASS
jgi:hypothetical protein